MRPRQEFLHVQHQETLLFFPPSNSFGPKLCIRTRSVGFLDARIAIPCQASSSPLRNKDLLGTSSYLVPPPPRLLLIWAVGFSIPSQSFRDALCRHIAGWQVSADTEESLWSRSHRQALHTVTPTEVTWEQRAILLLSFSNSNPESFRACRMTLGRDGHPHSSG